MPIDTAAKRKAISGVGIPFLAPGVTPDSTKPAIWRASVGWSYFEEAVVILSDGRNIYLKWEPTENKYVLIWEDNRFNNTYTVPDYEVNWINIG